MILNTVYLQNLSPSYLPPSPGATDFRIRCGQFLAQISGFPQFLKAWPVLLAQVRVDRVQPFVEAT